MGESIKRVIPKKDLQILMDDITLWADDTFGKGRTCSAPLYHLMEEVEETLDSIREESFRISIDQIDHTMFEFADCFILILNAASKYGMNADGLMGHAKKKMAINKKRTWGKPDANGVVKHLK